MPSRTLEDRLGLLLQEASVLGLQGAVGEAGVLYAMSWLLPAVGPPPPPPERLVCLSFDKLVGLVAVARGESPVQWRGSDFSCLERTYLPATRRCVISFGSPYTPDSAEGLRIANWAPPQEAAHSLCAMMWDPSYKSELDLWLWYDSVQVSCPGRPSQDADTLFDESDRFWQAILDGDPRTTHLPFEAVRGASDLQTEDSHPRE